MCMYVCEWFMNKSVCMCVYVCTGALSLLSSVQQAWQGWDAMRSEYLGRAVGPLALATLASTGLDAFRDDLETVGRSLFHT